MSTGIDPASPRTTNTATAEAPTEVLIEMPLSMSLAFEDAADSGEHDVLDELRMATNDGCRAAVDTLTRAARTDVAAIHRTGSPLPRREHGAITVHTTRHEYGVEEVFPYLHAHLLVDPVPVTGQPDDYVSGRALADTVPLAQATAVRTATEQLKQAGYPVTHMPRQSPHGWELSHYVEDALDQLDGGRAFTCPAVHRGARRLFPVDFDDPATRADRTAGRL